MKKMGNATGAESAARQALELLRAVAERPGAGPLELNEYANSLLKTEFPSLRQPAKALELSLRVVQTDQRSRTQFHGIRWHGLYYLTGDRNAAVKAERKALTLVPLGSVAAQGLRRELEQGLTRFESASPK